MTRPPSVAGDDLRYAVAVASLPQMTPQRLRHLLRGESAEEVFSQIRSGSPKIEARLATMGSFAAPRGNPGGPGQLGLGVDLETGPGGVAGKRADARSVLRAWATRARLLDVDRHWESLQARAVSVVRYGDGGYPQRLSADGPEAPELLFALGDLALGDGPTAAVVGTRRATHYGCEVAAELGVGLARAGVCVVSGLALGIDGAAHEGALAGSAPGLPGPLGVLAGGVDVPYPLRHERLIERVARGGCVTSETFLGVRPEAWRFPLRNRIIAGLAQVVVVVESSRHGGAMHTVEAANARGRDVFAVPGSVRSDASAGTNSLLAAGALLAMDVDDVLVAVERRCSLEGIGPPCGGTVGRSGSAPATRLSGETISRRLRDCTEVERRVYAAVEEHRALVDGICSRSDLELGRVVLALDRLFELGLVEQVDAGWRRRSAGAGA